jgi:hypothetical protein
MIADAAICFTLGLWVLLRGVTKKVNFAFYIFSWSVTLWAIDRYAFYTNTSSGFFFREIYALATVALLTGGAWIIYLIIEKPNKFLIGFYYSISAFYVTTPFWDHWSMQNQVIKNGILTYKVEFTYFLYIGLAFFPVFYVFYLLLKQLWGLSRYTKSYRWYQLVFITIGFGTYFITEFIYGFALFLFNMGPAVPVDYFASIIFIIFSAYALIALDKERVIQAPIT